MTDLFYSLHRDGTPMVVIPDEEMQYRLGQYEKGTDDVGLKAFPGPVISHTNGLVEQPPLFVQGAIPLVDPRLPPIIPPEIMEGRTFKGTPPAPKIWETTTYLRLLMDTRPDGTLKQDMKNPAIMQEQLMKRELIAAEVRDRIRRYRYEGNLEAAKALAADYQSYLAQNPYGPNGPITQAEYIYEGYQ